MTFLKGSDVISDDKKQILLKSMTESVSKSGKAQDEIDGILD